MPFVPLNLKPKTQVASDREDYIVKDTYKACCTSLYITSPVVWRNMEVLIDLWLVKRNSLLFSKIAKTRTTFIQFGKIPVSSERLKYSCVGEKYHWCKNQQQVMTWTFIRL